MLYCFLIRNIYSGSVIYNTHVPNLTAYHVQPKNIRLGAMVTSLLSLLFYFSNNHNGYGYLVTFVTFCTFTTFIFSIYLWLLGYFRYFFTILTNLDTCIFIVES